MSAVGAQAAFYVYAEASVGSSKSNANSTTWQNTTLTGQNISLKAEGDTTLRGATAMVDRSDVKTGHVINVVNQNGVIRFLDGQAGKAADLSKFKSLHLLKTK